MNHKDPAPILHFALGLPGGNWVLPTVLRLFFQASFAYKDPGQLVT